MDSKKVADRINSLREPASKLAFIDSVIQAREIIKNQGHDPLQKSRVSTEPVDSIGTTSNPKREKKIMTKDEILRSDLSNADVSAP